MKTLTYRRRQSDWVDLRPMLDRMKNKLEKIADFLDSLPAGWERHFLKCIAIAVVTGLAFAGTLLGAFLYF